MPVIVLNSFEPGVLVTLWSSLAFKCEFLAKKCTCLASYLVLLMLVTVLFLQQVLTG